MQFTKTIAVLAAAAAAQAYSNSTVVYTTIVVDSYTTVCPASSTITFNGVTYTNTLTEVRDHWEGLEQRRPCDLIWGRPDQQSHGFI